MMKKIYVFTAALLAAVTISAQRNYTVSTLQFDAGTGEYDRSSIDTIGPGAAFSAPVLYNSTNGGYVVGNNGYGDKQKVQIFYPTDVSFVPVPYTIQGALYWFGGKTVAGTPGNVKLRVYKIDGVGHTNLAMSACPNTTIVSDNVSMATVDTALTLANISAYTFSTAAPQTTLNPDGYYSVGVGFDLTGLNVAMGDTIGLVSSTDGDVDGAFPAASWEQWSTNEWFSFENDSNWNLSIDLAIFPIGFNTASAQEETFLSGVSVSAVSPFTGAGQFTYHLLNNAQKASINIIDMRGSILYTKELSNVAAGKYILDYDGSNLAPGTYFIMFQADKGRMASKFIKQ
jgi:hypothetical protein